MPLAITNNSALPLPLDSSLSVRARDTDADGVQADSRQTSADLESVEAAAARAETGSAFRSSPTPIASRDEAVLLQPAPTFDEFPNSQRQALQLYSNNQRAATLSDSAQLIVGIDTFV